MEIEAIIPSALRLTMLASPQRSPYIQGESIPSISHLRSRAGMQLFHSRVKSQDSRYGSRGQACASTFSLKKAIAQGPKSDNVVNSSTPGDCRSLPRTAASLDGLLVKYSLAKTSCHMIPLMTNPLGVDPAD